MSLINDALKRVRKEKASSPSSASPESALEPAEHSAANPRQTWLVTAGSSVIAILAAWFIWQWWTKSQLPDPVPPARAQASTADTLTAKPESAATDETNSTASSQAEIAVDTGASNPIEQANAVMDLIATREQGSQETAPAQSEVVESEPVPDAPAMASTSQQPQNPPAEAVEPRPLPPSRPVQFPSLKLQGIFYRLTNPSVLINNRTLYIGDEIEGARVVAIERYTAKVQMSGQTQILRLK